MTRRIWRELLRHYYARMALQTILLKDDAWRLYAQQAHDRNLLDENPSYGSVGWAAECARFTADHMVRVMARPVGMIDRQAEEGRKNLAKAKAQAASMGAACMSEAALDEIEQSA